MKKIILKSMKSGFITLMLKHYKKEKLKKTEEETRKALQDVPFDEKIVFLNCIKYCMQMESHAYTQGVKFAEELYKLKKPVDKESFDDFSKIICFKEKIEIVDKLIREELENQRIEQLV